MDQLISLIYQYGLTAMFFLILIEYACFPVSSEIVLPLSGAVASLQGIPFFLIVVLSILAGLIGTSICYFIGYLGGNLALDYIMTKFPASRKGIKSSIDTFEKHKIKAILLGRMIPLCRTYISFAAGIAKQNFLHFLAASSIGIAIWNTILIGIGYLLQNNWTKASIYYQKYKFFIIPFLCIILIFFLIKKKFVSKRIHKEKN